MSVSVTLRNGIVFNGSSTGDRHTREMPSYVPPHLRNRDGGAPPPGRGSGTPDRGPSVGAAADHSRQPRPGQSTTKDAENTCAAAVAIAEYYTGQADGEAFRAWDTTRRRGEEGERTAGP
jgi:hypothetical protein